MGEPNLYFYWILLHDHTSSLSGSLQSMIDLILKGLSLIRLSLSTSSLITLIILGKEYLFATVGSFSVPIIHSNVLLWFFSRYIWCWCVSTISLLFQPEVMFSIVSVKFLSMRCELWLLCVNKGTIQFLVWNFKNKILEKVLTFSNTNPLLYKD